MNPNYVDSCVNTVDKTAGRLSIVDGLKMIAAGTAATVLSACGDGTMFTDREEAAHFNNEGLRTIEMSGKAEPCIHVVTTRVDGMPHLNSVTTVAMIKYAQTDLNSPQTNAGEAVDVVSGRPYFYYPAQTLDYQGNRFPVDAPNCNIHITKPSQAIAEGTEKFVQLPPGMHGIDTEKIIASDGFQKFSAELAGQTYEPETDPDSPKLFTPGALLASHGSTDQTQVRVSNMPSMSNVSTTRPALIRDPHDIDLTASGEIVVDSGVVDENPDGFEALGIKPIPARLSDFFGPKIRF